MGEVPLYKSVKFRAPKGLASPNCFVQKDGDRGRVIVVSQFLSVSPCVSFPLFSLLSLSLSPAPPFTLSLSLSHSLAPSLLGVRERVLY